MPISDRVRSHNVIEDVKSRIASQIHLELGGGTTTSSAVSGAGDISERTYDADDIDEFMFLQVLQRGKF